MRVKVSVNDCLLPRPWLLVYTCVTICPVLCVSTFQVVLLFPGPGAVSVQDMMQCLLDRHDSRSHDSSEPRVKRLKTEGVQGRAGTAKRPETDTPDEGEDPESRLFPLQRVVFIDSTWNQTKKISSDERLQGNLSFSTALHH